QAEDGIRDLTVTGVQTCALPIYDLVGRASLLSGAGLPDNDGGLAADGAAGGVLQVEGHLQVVAGEEGGILQVQEDRGGGRLRSRSEERRVGKEGGARRAREMEKG